MPEESEDATKLRIYLVNIINFTSFTVDKHLKLILKKKKKTFKLIDQTNGNYGCFIN